MNERPYHWTNEGCDPGVWVLIGPDHMNDPETGCCGSVHNLDHGQPERRQARPWRGRHYAEGRNQSRHWIRTTRFGKHQFRTRRSAMDNVVRSLRRKRAYIPDCHVEWPSEEAL